MEKLCEYIFQINHGWGVRVGGRCGAVEGSAIHDPSAHKFCHNTPEEDPSCTFHEFVSDTKKESLPGYVNQ